MSATMHDDASHAREARKLDAPVTVCVDVMGGDEPPTVVLEGIERALASDSTLRVLAAGKAEVVEPFASSHDRCEALACSETIAMDEHPVQAIRKKRDSSIVVGCSAVHSGDAQAFFSAGSTGACMAAATFKIGRLSGNDRPALTTVIPGATPTVLLDLGANADCKPLNIVQYAHMGCAYARAVLGIENPRVGLLNIGSEETKGSMEAQERFAALREHVPQFVGNAESPDLFGDGFDVVVTDGFTGNIALKTIEGTAKYLLGLIKKSAGSSLRAKVGAGLMLPALREVKTVLSGDEFGGAVLLGVKGVVVIGHGATSPTAIMNGTLVAANAVRAGMTEDIERLCAMQGQQIDGKE